MDVQQLTALVITFALQQHSSFCLEDVIQNNVSSEQHLTKGTAKMSTAEPKLRKRSGAKVSRTNGAPQSSSQSAQSSPKRRSAPRSCHVSTAWLCGLIAAFLAILTVSMQKFWSSHTTQNEVMTPLTSKIQAHVHVSTVMDARLVKR